MHCRASREGLRRAALCPGRQDARGNREQGAVFQGRISPTMPIIWRAMQGADRASAQLQVLGSAVNPVLREGNSDR
eukprot:653537-Rhodomonas_salina.1